MSPQRSLMPKKRKSYWSVSEIGPSPLKVDAADDADDDADDADDDGQVGIWKAPLPDGTAELKITQLYSYNKNVLVKQYVQWNPTWSQSKVQNKCKLVQHGAPCMKNASPVIFMVICTQIVQMKVNF